MDFRRKNFEPGERVKITDARVGESWTGTVESAHRRLVIVLLDDGRRMRSSPGFVTRINERTP